MAFWPLNLDRMTALPREPVGLFALGMTERKSLNVQLTDRKKVKAAFTRKF